MWRKRLLLHKNIMNEMKCQEQNYKTASEYAWHEMQTASKSDRARKITYMASEQSEWETVLANMMLKEQEHPDSTGWDYDKWATAWRGQSLCGWVSWYLRAIGGDNKMSRAGGTFCKGKMCIACAEAKSRIEENRITDVLNALQMQKLSRDGTTYAYIALTLDGGKNVTGAELPERIDAMLKAFDRLTKDRSIKGICKGGIRNLEITRHNTETYRRKNPETGKWEKIKDEWYGTYHPHYHIVMLVNQNYFKGKRYLSREKWLEIWRRCMKDSTITNISVKRTENIHQAVKYNAGGLLKHDTAEEEGLRTGNIDYDGETYRDIITATKNRRMKSYFGNVKDIARYIREKTEAELDTEDRKAELYELYEGKRQGAKVEVRKASDETKTAEEWRSDFQRKSMIDKASRKAELECREAEANAEWKAKERAYKTLPEKEKEKRKAEYRTKERTMNEMYQKPVNLDKATITGNINTEIIVQYAYILIEKKYHKKHCTWQSVMKTLPKLKNKATAHRLADAVEALKAGKEYTE